MFTKLQISDTNKMPAKRHTHKYHRIPFGRTKVWACALTNEGCTHHLPHNMEGTIVNRLSICWECENEYVIDENCIVQDKPRCKDCRGVGSIESILAQKGLL